MKRSSESHAQQAVVTKRLDRHPDDVWEHLTGDEGFAEWMGPGSTIEVEPGGGLIAADPESGQPKIGRVLDVEPGRILHWVWRPLGEDEPTTEVHVTVEPGHDELLPVPSDDPSRSADQSPTHTLITVTERPSTIGVASASGVSSVASSALAATC